MTAYIISELKDLHLDEVEEIREECCMLLGISMEVVDRQIAYEKKCKEGGK